MQQIYRLPLLEVEVAKEVEGERIRHVFRCTPDGLPALLLHLAILQKDPSSAVDPFDCAVLAYQLNCQSLASYK